MSESNPRQSIQATHDHCATGDRFTVESRVAGRRISLAPMPDPFIHTTVHVGWRELLRGLLRRGLSVSVIVSGDREIIEDIMELNDDYKGAHGSTRRQAWDRQLDTALGDFAARAGEHDVS